MKFYDESQYFGFDGAFRFGITPIYPNWDEDVHLPTQHHDFSKDKRSDLEKKIDKMLFTEDYIRNQQKYYTFHTLALMTIVICSYRNLTNIPRFITFSPYIIGAAAVGPTTWYGVKYYYIHQYEERNRILWYMRNHQDQLPPPMPRKKFAEVLIPWFPTRNM